MSRHTVLSLLRKAAINTALGVTAIAARTIRVIVPAARQYDCVVAFAGAAARGASLAARASGRSWTGADYHSEFVQHMLCAATRHGGIDIKVLLSGADILGEIYRRHGHAILCTAHFGLTLAIARALADLSIPVSGIGKVQPSMSGWHWGVPERLRIIASSPYCFVRARRALETGRVLVAYPDDGVYDDTDGRPVMVIKPNLFSFAARLKCPVLFFGAKLAEDGAILIDIVRPDHAFPQTAADARGLAEEFFAFVSARSKRPCRMEPGRRTVRNAAQERPLVAAE